MPLKSRPIVVLYLKREKKEKTTIKYINEEKRGAAERSLIDEEGKKEMYELRIRTTRVIAKGIILRFLVPRLRDRCY